MYITGPEMMPCIDCKTPTEATVKNPAPICPDCLLKRDGKLYKTKVGCWSKADKNQMGIFLP